MPQHIDINRNFKEYASEDTIFDKSTFPPFLSINIRITALTKAEIVEANAMPPPFIEPTRRYAATTFTMTETTPAIVGETVSS